MLTLKIFFQERKLFNYGNNVKIQEGGCSTLQEGIKRKFTKTVWKILSLVPNFWHRPYFSSLRCKNPLHTVVEMLQLDPTCFVELLNHAFIQKG